MSRDVERRYAGRSLWLDGIAETLTPRPPLPGDRTYDVAIVGAGFTGLWAAYYLKQYQPDLRIAVLEREIAGFGPAGRNGGAVSSGLAGSAATYARSHSKAAVLRAMRETYNAIVEIENVVRREEIECDFTRGGGIWVATTEPQRQRLKQDIREMHAWGLTDSDIRLIGPDEARDLIDVPGCVLAAFNPQNGRANPARLVRGLADACERNGVTIFERTQALRILGREIHCDSGTVRADHVLRTTEAYTTQLPGHRSMFLPLYSLMIATEPLPPGVLAALRWHDGMLVHDRRHLFFYAQLTADGRIAIGGRGAPYRLRSPISEASERNDAVAKRLLRALHNHFPAAQSARVTHHWGGPLAVPRDWSMAVSYDKREGLGWAGGYSGHGVVASNIAGRTLAEVILERDTDRVTLPWVGHKSRRWEPEPIRYFACQAIVRILASADKREDATDRRAWRSKLVAPFMPPR